MITHICSLIATGGRSGGEAGIGGGGGGATGVISLMLAMSRRNNTILPCYVGVIRPKEYGSFAVLI